MRLVYLRRDLTYLATTKVQAVHVSNRRVSQNEKQTAIEKIERSKIIAALGAGITQYVITRVKFVIALFKN